MPPTSGRLARGPLAGRPPATARQRPLANGDCLARLGVAFLGYEAGLILAPSLLWSHQGAEIAQGQEHSVRGDGLGAQRSRLRVMVEFISHVTPPSAANASSHRRWRG